MDSDVTKKQHNGFFAIIHKAGCPKERVARMEWINAWRAAHGLPSIKSTKELNAAAKSQMQMALRDDKNF